MITSYIRRLIDDEPPEVLAAHPAVLLVGPRAAGKTTTGRQLPGIVTDSTVYEAADIDRKTAVAYEHLFANLFVLDADPHGSRTACRVS